MSASLEREQIVVNTAPPMRHIVPAGSTEFLCGTEPERRAVTWEEWFAHAKTLDGNENHVDCVVCFQMWFGL